MANARKIYNVSPSNPHLYKALMEAQYQTINDFLEAYFRVCKGRSPRIVGKMHNHLKIV